MKHNLYNHKQNVLELQGFLRANHLLEGGALINPHGIYDRDTADAVLLFQKQNGLPMTGEADFTTWTLLARNAELICNESQCLLVDLEY